MSSFITTWGIGFFGVGGTIALLSIFFQPCTFKGNSLYDIIFAISFLSALIGIILIILGFFL